jgi:hypothetical protein
MIFRISGHYHYACKALAVDGKEFTLAIISGDYLSFWICWGIRIENARRIRINIEKFRLISAKPKAVSRLILCV